MIELKNISHNYNSHKTLQNISFNIKEKEKVVLLGVNGSGKTTLLKILNGLIFPTKGDFFYKREKIDEKKLKNKKFNQIFRKEVVLLFQNPDTMLFNPTVYDEIAFGLRNLEIEHINEKVKYWAERLGIDKYLNVPPFELSNGEKQKVCIASLLAVEPAVVLLDEPTANLDPRSVGWFVEFLYELDLTSIITTHNLSLAPELGQRGIVLSENHELLYDGNIEDLLKDEEKLIKANLIHIHKHTHFGIQHAHYHKHEF